MTGTVRWLRGERDCQVAGVTGTFRSYGCQGLSGSMGDRDCQVVWGDRDCQVAKG